MLMLILTVALIVALVGALPTWPHSKNWGYYPIGGVSLVILIVLVLLLTGRL
jgi:bacteriorhodopsin